MDLERLARELVRAVRGPRSQRAFSRRLGYHSNVLAAWEAGRRAPTAAEFARAAVAAGIDMRAAWSRFHRVAPPWLDHVDPTTSGGVARLLDDLRGDVPVAEVARRASVSRFAARRWLSGEAEPRLPAFLGLLDALSLRLLDWCAALVDVERLPAARADWARLEAHRQAAYTHPWTQAVLRALELVAYPPHRPGWIEARLGLPAGEEARCLDVLARAGQILWVGDRWVVAGTGAVDTRRDPASGRRLKRFWAEEGVRRLGDDEQGLWSYNVFSVSEADLVRLRELHRAYFRTLRALVEASTPGERVVVANVHLFALDGVQDGGGPR